MSAPVNKASKKCGCLKDVPSITRYCHNHSLYTNSRHRKEEIQNANSKMSARRQSKQSNQLSVLSRRDDCKTRMDAVFCIIKQDTDTHHKSDNKQRSNNNKTIVLDRTANKAIGLGVGEIKFVLDA